MTDETPQPISSRPVQNPSNSGWKPTTSTLAGAAIGGAVAHLVVVAIEYFLKVTLDRETANDIMIVCVAATGYLFPDGGRK